MKNNLMENKILYLQAVLMGLLPLVCCLVYCAVEGYSVGQVYLANSEWNDELFYFKQVESILEYGYPQGYFGFNESHALKLSFAAWSPVLVFPWLVLGKIFGWTLMSPIYYNIFLLMVTMVGFVLIVKPTWKQIGLLTILFCTYTPFVRYMLCGMPEVICFCMLIFWFSVMLSHLEKATTGKLVWLFVLASLMTLMRPYLILFLLYPLGCVVLEKKWKGAVLSLGILGVVAVIYWAINHYLAAEYFTPLFKTDWLEPFFTGDILGGIKGILVSLYYNGSTFKNLMLEGVRSGLCEGAIFAGYVAMMVLFAFQSVAEFVKKRKKQAFVYGYLAFSFFAMMIALLLMYKMKEGSKHLLTFMAVGIFAVAMMETRYYKKAMFIGVMCIYLYYIKAVDPYDYQVPFVSEEREEQLAYWENVFEEHLSLETVGVPNYDNVAIWVFSDKVGEDYVVTDWQIFYALPEGFGISCCYDWYVTENFGDLKSKYIATPADGVIAQMCEETGKKLLGADGNVCVYQIQE